MYSFSIITDGIYLQELLLKCFEANNLEIFRISEINAIKIVSPVLKDQYKQNEYLMLYVYEVNDEEIGQFNELERDMILKKKFNNPCFYSCDYNVNKSFELLCFLIDIINEMILSNFLQDKLLISEDINGIIYSFDDFYKQWVHKRGFFAL